MLHSTSSTDASASTRPESDESAPPQHPTDAKGKAEGGESSVTGKGEGGSEEPRYHLRRRATRQESSEPPSKASRSSNSASTERRGGRGRRTRLTASSDTPSASTTPQSKELGAGQGGGSGQQRKGGTGAAPSDSSAPPAADTTGNCSGTACLLGRSAAVHPEQADAMATGGGNDSGGAPAPGAPGQQPPQDRDQMEMGRLQQMLEARGLPGHLLGALGPRFGGLLSRGPGPSAKVQGLIQQMGKDGDESAQLTAVIELCNLLVMGNEETLGSGFPVKDVVRALLKLMQLEQNFEIMMQAVRGITYVMEALPRSTPIVVEAIPQLIQRLDRMECMDVAEQALTALDTLSKRHAKSVLMAGGVKAVLAYLDFFALVPQRTALNIAANCATQLDRMECMDVAEQALTALDTLSKRHAKSVLMAGGVKAVLAYLDFFALVPQRTALNIAANCATQVGKEELNLVLDSLPAMTEKLQQSDKKSVESVCAFFTRLVENLATTSPASLAQLAQHGLLSNVQTLLVATPTVVSTGTFMSLLRMLHSMCTVSSALAVELHRNGMPDTLQALLVANRNSEGLELVQRSAQELNELVLLIGELVPRLPGDGRLFAVGGLLARPGPAPEAVVWSWKDDAAHWRPYAPIDSRILEAAYQARESEVSLQVGGNTYTVDLENMMQINDDTGNSRPLHRRVSALQAGGGQQVRVTSKDTEDARLSLEPETLNEFVRKLFPVLYEVYATTAGPGIRQDCLGSMLRMIYHSSPELLREVLKNLSISSHIANMLSSTDLKIVVGALQLVRILLEKVPDVFITYFRREGVMHQVEKLVKVPPASPSQAGLSGKAGSEPVLASGLPLPPPPTAAGGPAFAHPFLVGLPSGAAAAAATAATGPAAPPLPIYGLLPQTSAPPSATGFPPPPAFSASAGAGTPGLGGLLDSLGGTPGVPPAFALGSCRFSGSLPGSVDLAAGQDPNSAWPVPAPPPAQQGASAVPAAATIPIVPAPNFANAEVLQVPTIPAVLSQPPPPPPDSEMHKPDTKGPAEPHESAGSASNATEDNESAKGSNRRESRQGKRRAAPLPGDLNLRSQQHKLRVERNNNEGKANSAAGRRKTSASESTSAATGAASRKTSASSVAYSTRSRAKAPVPSTLKAAASGAASGNAGASASRRSGSSDPAAGAGSGGHKPAQTKKSSGSFLAEKLSSLPLPRWARPGGQSAQAGSAERDAASRLSATMLAFQHHHPSASALPPAHLGASATLLGVHSGNKDKIRAWIREQAGEVMSGYFGTGEECDNAVLGRLSQIAAELCVRDVDLGTKPLESLETTVLDSDVSSFELLHSGLIPALHAFLTTPDHAPLTQTQDQLYPVSRSKRLKRFLNVFLAIKEEKGKSGRRSVRSEAGERLPAVSKLVAKLNACLNQVEQFPVKIHELAGSGSGLRGTSALRFFHTHQIKCILRRHPSSRELREWHRGPIKVDPLAQMSAIERYMIMKGYGRLRSQATGESGGNDANAEPSSSDDGGSEDEFEETLALSAGLGAHNRIQFLINDRVLPYEMTLYQAVRQYGLSSHNDADGDSDAGGLSYASIWVNTHTLWYRLAPDAAKAAASAPPSANLTSDSSARETGSPGPGVKDSGTAGRKKAKDPKPARSTDLLWNDGVVPGRNNPLADYLEKKVTISEDKAANEVLQLLRVLYGINKYWWAVFKLDEQTMKSFHPIMSTAEFVNGKLSGKVTRQLQDPLTVLSQQVPGWVRSLATTCPFVLSFESRQAVFATCALDRDRALQRLTEALPELAGGADGADGGQGRIAPRLERRKVSIHREDLLKQAEAVINSMDGANRAVLEVQYQNEEGTGLGPTLEFYALVSRELQKARLGLWRDTLAHKRGEDEDALVSAPSGLYPLPLTRVIKQATVAKIRAKFHFLGRLLARALTDSRMLDLPISPVLYKWLLGEERSLSLADLWELDSGLVGGLQGLLENGREEIEGLDLDFTLPGSMPVAELRKGGKDMPVTADNLVDYVKLVTYWIVYEGVARQMEAFVEGFDSVLPVRHLRMFYAEEMESLFCGSSGAWDANVLSAHLRPDHGYNHDSAPIQWLTQLMAEFGEEEQRRFLHFITGSPKLPVGGFKALSPPLTVVRKACEDDADRYLPSVMTCVNYLKLPPYSSKEVMSRRLSTAVSWGQTSFHLS